ncbi:MAG: transcriptional regulator [Proteobacteria bacterium]|nr:transcriptional regulator [Pseudomonadota bacterium]
MTDKNEHPLLKTHPHLQEFVAFLEHLKIESERGQVLISAAMLDDLLMQIIQAFLIKGDSANKLLSGFNAPLGSLSSRVEAAHALGLISREERSDATIIRKIRNEFAHTLAVSFEDQQVKDKCAALHFSANDYEDVVVSPRGQFSTAATALILNLTNRPHYVGKKCLSWQAWPY